MASTKTIVADPEGDVLLLLEPTEKAQTSKTKVLCSSKHLRLASAVFKAMLRPNVYNEGTVLSHVGKVEIPLLEDNTEIMTTLVLLIHGRHQHPNLRPMENVESLCQAAILVDKYQMHEATNFLTAQWAGAYFHDYPVLAHPLSDLPLLLCITWVFNMADDFKVITRQIKHETVGSIIDSVASFHIDLPIPQSVIQKLENSRNSDIRSVYEGIRLMITNRENYIDSSRRFCKATSRSDTVADVHEAQEHRKRCDRVVLDSLISGALEFGLWPLDVARSLASTSSFYRVTQKAINLEFTTECERLMDLHIDHTGIVYEFGSLRRIKRGIEAGVKEIEERLTGLNLKFEKRRFDMPMLETHR
ncbi:hypothetical protein BCIN_11g05370 [Botrytis cinerea B05.10]|uniref:BTB domain-containing protein n=1 Tax=Botryotinia fuckeliana (strain B05.10) TaxID=332648 RepID=A0A384JXG9_BOTFB|nr:hypothetical protein BCIN_11g05370 [Botrytis cinerea B05.10]ATZ55263.1 hypothetical protein BCIN_11g05370 [Botrytis cinerea B05.10]